MTDYDHTRALVASEAARKPSGLMDMILARLDADTVTIADLRDRLAKAEARIDTLHETIDWNTAQYERWKAERSRAEMEREARLIASNEVARRVLASVHDARLARRKTVRVADLFGEAS